MRESIIYFYIHNPFRNIHSVLPEAMSIYGLRLLLYILFYFGFTQFYFMGIYYLNLFLRERGYRFDFDTQVNHL